MHRVLKCEVSGRSSVKCDHSDARTGADVCPGFTPFLSQSFLLSAENLSSTKCLILKILPHPFHIPCSRQKSCNSRKQSCANLGPDKETSAGDERSMSPSLPLGENSPCETEEGGGSDK